MISDFLRKNKSQLFHFLILGGMAGGFEVGFVLILKKLASQLADPNSLTSSSLTIWALAGIFTCVLGRTVIQWIQSRNLIQKIYSWVQF